MKQLRRVASETAGGQARTALIKCEKTTSGISRETPVQTFFFHTLA